MEHLKNGKSQKSLFAFCAENDLQNSNLKFCTRAMNYPVCLHVGGGVVFIGCLLELSCNFSVKSNLYFWILCVWFLEYFLLFHCLTHINNSSFVAKLQSDKLKLQLCHSVILEYEFTEKYWSCLWSLVSLSDMLLSLIWCISVMWWQVN